MGEAGDPPGRGSARRRRLHGLRVAGGTRRRERDRAARHGHDGGAGEAALALHPQGAAALRQRHGRPARDVPHRRCLACRRRAPHGGDTAGRRGSGLAGAGRRRRGVEAAARRRDRRAGPQAPDPRGEGVLRGCGADPRGAGQATADAARRRGREAARHLRGAGLGADWGAARHAGARTGARAARRVPQDDARVPPGRGAAAGCDRAHAAAAAAARPRPRDAGRGKGPAGGPGGGSGARAVRAAARG